MKIAALFRFLLSRYHGSRVVVRVFYRMEGVGNPFAAVKHPALKCIFRTELMRDDPLLRPLDFRKIAEKAIESHGYIAFQNALHRQGRGSDQALRLSC